VAEESFLSLSAVVVHAVTKNAKIDVLLLLDVHQEHVLFVVAMRVYKRYHALDYLRFMSFCKFWVVQKLSTEDLVNIPAHCRFNICPGYMTQTDSLQLRPLLEIL
jgi:hypothetical protein